MNKDHGTCGILDPCCVAKQHSSIEYDRKVSAMESGTGGGWPKGSFYFKH